MSCQVVDKKQKIRNWLKEKPVGQAFQPAITHRKFQPLLKEDLDQVHQYKRRLPHWEKAGSTYFVTFRVHKTLGKPLIEKPALADVVEEALWFGYGERYVMDAYVIMPDHVHVLLRPLHNWRLSKILQGIKGYASREINKIIKRKGSFWQDENFDHLVRNEASWKDKFEYVHNNPVKAGLVDRPEDYKFSSLVTIHSKGRLESFGRLESSDKENYGRLESNEKNHGRLESNEKNHGRLESKDKNHGRLESKDKNHGRLESKDKNHGRLESLPHRSRKKYKLIDHTADFGIHVFGADPKELFANAAYALFDMLTEIDLLKGTDSLNLQVTGDDRADLMVNWLRELLYLWNGKEFLVKTVRISSLSETGLAANIAFDPFDPDRHVIHTEIKAVTYHQIQVSGKPEGWEAKIIFDI